MGQSININVQNTDPVSIIPVNLLGNPANLQDNANATTGYFYGTNTFTPTNENVVELQWRVLGTTQWNYTTANVLTPTVQGIADALTSIGAGIFFVGNYGTGDVLQAYNDYFEYGYVNTFNGGTCNISFNFFPIIAPNTLNIDINAVNVASYIAGQTPSGILTPNVGDTVTVYGVNDSTVGFVWVSQTPNFTFLFQTPALGVPTPYSFSFTAEYGKSYLIQNTP